jgi:hypothetical protein
MRMNTPYLSVFLAISSAAAAVSTGLPPELRFEENRGQTGADVRFLSTGGRLQVQLETSGAIALIASTPLRLTFPGSRPAADWRPRDPVWTNRYLLGNDPSQWVPEARVYRSVRRESLYPGIDLVLYGNGRTLEYDLVVAPGADPSRIRLKFHGARRIKSGPDGALEIESPDGTLFEQRLPAIYQSIQGKRRTVDGRFVQLRAGEFALTLGAFDRRQPLVIDPVLNSLTLIGGENEDEVIRSGRGTLNGPAFIAGHTRSVSFGRTRRRSQDIFITVQPSERRSGYTLFYGGSGDDELGSINFRDSHWILGGTTNSRDLPLVPDPSPPSPAPPTYRGGATDGFWVRFHDSFPSLSLAGDYVGGSGDDRVTGADSNISQCIVVGDTNSPDLPVRDAWQGSLAGGTDLFVMVFASQRRLQMGTYYGGAGDETARASTGSLFSGLPSLWVGGETTSPDFPVTHGDKTLNGPSDGFLLNIVPYGAGISSDSVSIRPASQLLGGSAADSVTALFLPNNVAPRIDQLFVGGVTRSSDLPVVNAAQTALAGGADAFFGRWSLSGNAWLTLSYWGGNGDDEARAVWSDGYLHLAGVTRSADFPLREPLQNRPGGGADGFYLFLDQNDAPVQSTYFGGSADDSLETIINANTPFLLPPASSLLLGGITRSTDLPAPPDSFSQDIGGGRNGFLAEIATNTLIPPERVSIAKDTLRHIQLPGGFNGRFEIRSSRPDLVQVLVGDRPSSEGAFNGSWFTIEAYADTGEADLTLSATGFPPRVIKVTLRPAFLQIQQLPPITTIWSGAFPLTALIAAANPETGIVEGYSAGPRTGLNPLRLEWVSSDPSVLAVDTNPVSGAPTLQPLKLGVAEVTLANPLFPLLPGANTRVEVRKPELKVPAVPPSAGRDLLTNFVASYQIPGLPQTILAARGAITYRSTDPSRLLLSVSPATAGSESVTLNAVAPSGLPVVLLHALADSGTVDVQVTASQAESGTLPVRLTRSYLALNDNQDLRVPPESREYTFRITPVIDGANPSLSSTIRPELSNIPIRLSSSNPQVVQLVSDAVLANNRQALLRVAGPGEAVIVAELPGSHIAPGRMKVVVTPAARTLRLPPEILVGKDLRTRVSIIASEPANGQVLLRVANPEIARLSTGNQPGSPEIRVPLGPSSNSFWVEGLSATGSTELILEADGVTTRSTIVALPSGISWSDSRINLTAGDELSVAIGTYMLDDLTGEPLGIPMSVRPGVTASVSVSSSSDAVQLFPATIDWNIAQASSTRISIRTQRPGEHTLKLRASGNFAATPDTLRISATRRRILAADTTIPRDTMAPFSFTTTTTTRSSQPGLTFTATSSDPSRLLLSETPTSPPQASVRINTPNVYLHALAGEGSATLTLAADDLLPAEVSISFLPLTISLDASSVSPTQNPPGYNLRIPSAPSTIGIRLGTPYSSFVLRPGAEPVHIDAVSSDTAVFAVDPPRLSLSANNTTATFRISPLAPGVAELRLSNSRSLQPTLIIRVEVRRSTLVIPPLIMGTNHQTPTAISLESGSLAPSESFIIKVTSPDPSRILLSRSPTTPGSPSISVVWPANSDRSNLFFVQALGIDGNATLRAEGDPFEPATSQFPVRRSFFFLSDISSPGPLTSGQRNVVELRPGFSTGQADEPNPAIAIGVLRPGIGDQRVTLLSSNPNVISTDPDTVLFREGDQQQIVSVLAGAPGTATLSLRQPAGFGEPPQNKSISYTVSPSPLTLDCSQSSTSIAKDSQQNCAISAIRAPEGVTITSSDSARIQFSLQPDGPLASRLNLPGTGGTNVPFFVHALSDSGSVTITATAPGFTPATRTLQLQRSAFAFGYPDTTTLDRGQRLALSVHLVALAPDGSIARFTTTRSGLNVRLDLASSAPGVARVEPATLNFGANTASLRPELVGIASGSTTVSLSVPPGFTPPPVRTLTINIR